MNSVLLLFGLIVLGVFAVIFALGRFSVKRKNHDLEDRLYALESHVESIEAYLEGVHEGAIRSVAPIPDEVSSAPDTLVQDDVVPESYEAPPRSTPKSVATTTHVASPLESRPSERTAVSSSPTAPPPLPPTIEVAAAEPGILENVVGWLKRLGPKESMTWEMALGTYWLPRLGVGAVSVAIVFLLTLAMQHGGPWARVGIGYAVSGCMLGLGWWLDRRYPAYARVVFAAGFALTYLVTFATYFVPFAQVFTSPFPTLGALAVIVGVWIAQAQRKQSPVIAGLAIILGHFTTSLATYAMDAPGPYTVAGVVFLTLGGAFFLMRNGWYAVAAAGLFGSYLNHFYLLITVDGAGTRPEFAFGIGILAVYFLVYAGAELLAPRELRRDRIPAWFRNAFVTANSLAVLLLGTLLLDGYDFARGHQDLFRYVFGAVLLLFSLAYLRLREGDPLHNTYFTKGVSVATWGLAFQFDAMTLTVALAIESVVLLAASRRSGLAVSRVLAFGVAALALFHGWITIVDLERLAYSDPGYGAHLAEAVLVAVALWLGGFLYERTEWTRRSPSATRFGDAFNAVLWKLDLVSTAPEGMDSSDKPLGGRLIPHVFSLGAASLAVGYATRLSAPGDTGLVLAASGAALTLAAALARSRAWGAAALVILGVAGLFGTWEIFDGLESLKAIALLVFVLIVALASEHRYAAHREGLTYHQQAKAPYALYGLFTWLTGCYLVEIAVTPSAILWSFLAAVLVAAPIALVLHRRAWALAATAFLLVAHATWLIEWTDQNTQVAWLDQDTQTIHLLGWSLIAVSLALGRYVNLLRFPTVAGLATTSSGLAFVTYVYRAAEPAWTPLLWTAGGVAFAAYAVAVRDRVAAGVGVTVLALGSIHQVLQAGQTDMPTALLVTGFLAPAACWIALDRLIAPLANRFDAEHSTPLHGALAAFATTLMVLMFYFLPGIAEFYLTIAWSLLGFALFGLALAFGERMYRFCGLAVIALASLQVSALLLLTDSLDTLPKVLAFGALGLVMLALGFGYVKAFARSQPGEAD